ncbi:protein of unknown function [Methanoculleus bourgensis]|uniref:Uncharacterized protein n=1 Tax=Methanoculleus bourgensis TaxID=83986 RepID=A0A0X3BP63_9EURY|nr:protein of unknown function [Methanoculleus bourgensis]
MLNTIQINNMTAIAIISAHR